MHTPDDKRAPGAGPERRATLTLRSPEAHDGARVHDLIAACPPLDRNSLYCNLLQCTHFADTCILAEQGERLLGWISGYRPPAEPSTLFVWQVAVHGDARGTGLGGKLLMALLDRPGTEPVRFIKTTVTPDNEASRALFRSVARRARAPMREQSGFEKDTHFRGRHDSERLIVIGPIPEARQRVSSAA
jgi:L-2,4-diaminobutyric acid acetyltransferase